MFEKINASILWEIQDAKVDSTHGEDKRTHFRKSNSKSDSLSKPKI